MGAPGLHQMGAPELHPLHHVNDVMSYAPQSLEILITFAV